MRPKCFICGNAFDPVCDCPGAIPDRCARLFVSDPKNPDITAELNMPLFKTVEDFFAILHRYTEALNRLKAPIPGSQE